MRCKRKAGEKREKSGKREVKVVVVEEEEQAEGRRVRRRIEKGRKRGGELYARFLSDASRQLFTSERTGRSIRNVVSLSVEVASAFW